MKQNKLKKNPGPVYAWPMGLWFTVFFIIPIAIIVCYSFMKRDVHGGVIAEFTLKTAEPVDHLSLLNAVLLVSY